MSVLLDVKTEALFLTIQDFPLQYQNHFMMQPREAVFSLSIQFFFLECTTKINILNIKSFIKCTSHNSLIMCHKINNKKSIKHSMQGPDVSIFYWFIWMNWWADGGLNASLISHVVYNITIITASEVALEFLSSLEISHVFFRICFLYPIIFCHATMNCLFTTFSLLQMLTNRK